LTRQAHHEITKPTLGERHAMAGFASEPWTAFKSERWTGFMSESPAAFIGIRTFAELYG